MKKALLLCAIGAGASGLIVGPLSGQFAAQPRPAGAGDGRIEEMLRVAGSNSDDASTRLRLAFALSAIGRERDAQAWYDQAARIDPAMFDRVMAGARGEMAQVRTTCPETSGPDVIVGDLPNTTRWGASGGITGYSVGTTSCNVGTADVLWLDGSNQHPVIAQNMYRLMNGRFEMIGQSWLKHGFLALTDSLCCSCNGHGGSVLGVGCSDPYDSGLNGAQVLLGPKSAVNAVTGFYPWPHATPSSGTIDGRLQVHNIDVDPTLNPGAQYFVEGQYVTADDAGANLDNNNASYRTCTIGAAPFNITLTGATVREEFAIQAWKDTDSSVNLVTTDVPGDGRFMLGHKVTNPSAGVWHYEYAIQNCNSDRSGQSFSLPVPSGVTITNIGFHDVDYHDGDGVGGVNQDGSDWSGVVSGGAITWSTTPFASNANANALHWGTLYNFRFDASTPPSSVSATLGLFKPGGPGSVSFAVMGPSAPPPPPCPADLNGDGMVGAADLPLLLGAWGGTGPADLNHDGVINGLDLPLLLGAWGPCP